MTISLRCHITGHLHDLEDVSSKNIHIGPLVLFDCSKEELADIGCIVNGGCYDNPEKGPPSCEEYCSDHLADCRSKGWEAVGSGHQRNLARSLGNNVAAVDMDLDRAPKTNERALDRADLPVQQGRRLKELCRRMRRYLKVREPLEQTFWERPDITDCWFSTYQLGLYADDHLAFAAFPLDEACPIIAVDAGLSDEDLELAQGRLPVLRKMVNIVDPEAVLKEVLYFDHEIQLHEFAHAAVHARTSRNKQLPGDHGREDVDGNYDIIVNNCATFILDMAKTLKLEYREDATYNIIINYVGERLAANPRVAESIFRKLEEDNGIWLTKFMTLMRGEAVMMKAVVRKYIESEH